MIAREVGTATGGVREASNKRDNRLGLMFLTWRAKPGNFPFGNWCWDREERYGVGICMLFEEASASGLK